jgi:hypothetical protein
MMVAWHEVPGKSAIAVPSRRARCDLRFHQKSFRVDSAGDRSWTSAASGQTVPYGTDPSCRIPRHFVPGYHHSVPPGRITHHSPITNH